MRTMKRFLFIFISAALLSPVCSQAWDFAGTPEEYAKVTLKKDIEEAKAIYRRFVKKEPTAENLIDTLRKGNSSDIARVVRLLRVDKVLAEEVPDTALTEGVKRTQGTRNSGLIRLEAGKILIQRGSPDGTNFLLSVLSDEKVDSFWRILAAYPLAEHGRLDGYPVVKKVALGAEGRDSEFAIERLVYFLPYENQPCGTNGGVVNVKEVVDTMSEKQRAIFNEHKARVDGYKKFMERKANEKNKDKKESKIEDSQNNEAENNTLYVRFVKVVYHSQDTEKKRPGIIFTIRDGGKLTTYAFKDKEQGEEVRGLVFSGYDKATGELVLKRGDDLIRLKQGQEIRIDGPSLTTPVSDETPKRPQAQPPDNQSAAVPSVAPPTASESPEPAAKVKDIEKPAEEPANSCMPIIVTIAGAIVLAGILGWLIYRNKR